MFDDARWRKSPEEMARRHPTRVEILAMLPGAEADGMTVEELRDALPDVRSDAAVAYHLAVLRHADLVQACGRPARFTLVT